MEVIEHGVKVIVVGILVVAILGPFVGESSKPVPPRPEGMIDVAKFGGPQPEPLAAEISGGCEDDDDDRDCDGDRKSKHGDEDEEDDGDDDEDDEREGHHRDHE